MKQMGVYLWAFDQADLLLLSSSEPYGLCYIETAELDGETNLKPRQALDETFEMGSDMSKIGNFDGQIICEAPNNRLNSFEGQLLWKNQSYPLDNDKMLLRGCVLRNTKWCFGIVIFAGRDTKLMMNSGKTTFKRTSLDRFLNVLIAGIVIFLISMCIICTILSSIWEAVYGNDFQVFLPWEDLILEHCEGATCRIAFIAFLVLFSYAILMNTVVPISLYVSVEIIRFFHSWCINWDEHMYYEVSDTPSRARTTTLNEELGQIQYIFSDKTGTLTQNIMTFNKCVIADKLYGEVLDFKMNPVDPQTLHTVDFSWNNWFDGKFTWCDQSLLEDLKNARKAHSKSKFDLHLEEFWRLLALCHTVMPEFKESENLIYQAQSPDEGALTSAARNMGFVFKSRTPTSITIELDGQEEAYELLCILDFNNVRKRMSVLVRRNGILTLYCKGADTVVFELLDKSSHENAQLVSTTQTYLDKLANEGLRTLCLAYRQISPEFFEKWIKKQKEAALSIENRQEKLDTVYEEIERNLLLLGVTAIEDKLQEGVPETIANLAAANIKIWVLTGDKQETAINIGYSCRLLSEEMRDIFVVDGAKFDAVQTQLEKIRRQLFKLTLTEHNGIHSGRRKKNKTGNMSIGSSGSVGDSHAPHDKHRHRQSSSSPSASPRFKSFFGSIKGSAGSSGRQKSDHNRNGITPKSDAEIRSKNTVSSQTPDESDIGEGYALVITGQSLAHALDQRLEGLFLDVGCQCQAVICCRVTPLQKALVVDLVKRNKKAVTLAVGDGANDVSMIKMAHIGVGISGQEGMQAVLASDYSIAQFRFLERLLLVHGRWSYYRMCKFLRYFFYKNFAFTLGHFWLSFFCAYSAQSVEERFKTAYDPLFIAFYNLFFTSLPVLALGVFDQDVNDSWSLKYSRLYIPGQFNLYFNMRIFVYSVLHGILSSFTLFFVCYGVMRENTLGNGHTLDSWPLLGFTVFSSLVVAVTAQIAVDTAYWTFWNHFVIWGSLLFYFLVAIFYYEFVPYYLLNQNGYGVAFTAMRSPDFWFCLLLTNVILILPMIALL
uniref:Phospholipid-transporting ATPase n=1 Tax=Romanomermis culicivorax TaxID=13658 RepID=A0A915HM86_ROMCU